MDLEERIRQSLERQAQSVRITRSQPDLPAAMHAGRRRARAMQVLVAALSLAVFAGAFALVWPAFRPGYEEDDGNSAGGEPASPVLVRSGEAFALGGDGRALAAGDGAIAASLGTGLVAFDPADGQTRQLPFAEPPTDITYAGGSLWAAGYERTSGPTVKRIDPRTATVLSRISFPTGTGVTLIAADDQGLWVVVVEGSARSYSLARIDLATNELVAEIPLPGPSASAPPGTYRDIRDISLGEGYVWVLGWDLVASDNQDPHVVDAVLLKIDPSVDQVSSEIALDQAANSIVAGGGAVWVALGNEGMDRYDIASDGIEHVDISGVFDGIAFADGYVWVVHASEGNVIDIASVDPSTQVIATSATLQSIGGNNVPVDAAFDPSTNRIWVLSEDGHVEEAILT